MTILIRTTALVICLLSVMPFLHSESYIPEVTDPQLQKLRSHIEDNDLEALQHAVLWEQTPVDAADNSGRTPLHYAAYAGRTEAARLLIRGGASIEAQDNAGRLPVHLADDPDLIRLLSGGGRLLFKPDNEGTTPAELLFERDQHVLEALLEAGYTHIFSDDGFTLLHTAAQLGAHESASYLLDRQAFVNAASRDGTLPVNFAFSRPESIPHLRTAHILARSGSNPPEDETYRYVFDVFKADTMDHRFARRASILHLAAEAGHTGAVIYALDQGAAVEGRDTAYRTAVHTAAQAGAREILMLLLEEGADPSAQDAAGDTPLHAALRAHGNPSIIHGLLNAGSSADAANRRGKTPLHTAAAHGDDPETAAMLIDGTVSVDSKDYQGRTPLLTALTSQAFEISQVLTAGGADIHARDHDGNTPAAQMLSSSPEVLSQLLLDSHIRETDSAGNTLVHLAAAQGADTSVFELLLARGASADRPNSSGDTPLHLALKHGRCSTAQLLITHGADPFLRTAAGITAVERAYRQGPECTAAVISDELLNAAGPKGDTPVLLAVRGGFLDICGELLDRGAAGGEAVHLAAGHNDIAMLQLLIRSSVPLDSRNASGSTPLHEASRNGANRAVRLLLLAGAAPDIRNAEGNTPLHLAVTADDPQVMRTLHEFNTPLNIRNNQGLTPLLTAASFGISDAAQLLVGFNADIHTADSQGNRPLHEAVRHRDRGLILALIEQGADIHGRNRSGETPLTLAVSLGTEQVSWLMEAGAVMKRDHEGNTPLHIAVSTHASGSALKRMIELGESVSSRNNRLETPLHTAVTHLHPIAAQVLLNHGADIFLPDSEGTSPLEAALEITPHALPWLLDEDIAVSDEQGNTPLHYAVRQGNSDAAAWLLDQGADPLRENSSGITPADDAEGTQLEEILRSNE